MEIVKSKYGQDRVITKINSSKFRVMGDSYSIMVSSKNGDMTGFDFEGGPCFNIGATFKYLGESFKIKRVVHEDAHTWVEDFVSVIVEVDNDK